jgi:glycerate dehydrogenase
MTNKMTNRANIKAVVLDEKSFNPGDLDLSGLYALLGNWTIHEGTSPEQRLERLEGADIVIANKVVLDQPLLENLPKLKLILLTATGMDNVDLAFCEQQGITVNNVTDYCTASVSQHVFSLILALSTQLFSYQKLTKSGDWSRSGQFSNLEFPIQELSGKTLGLVGYGSLAKGVEKVALAFGMNIIISQRAGLQGTVAGRLPFDELLAQADVVSIHCPLTPETKHLFSTKEFELMKSSALLINTARGGVIDNEALAIALRDNVIAGAGIDVLEQEPPPLDHPLITTKLPNLILTPHIAWAAIEARQRVIDKVAENLQRFLNH